jgi:hypothetical protein
MSFRGRVIALTFTLGICASGIIAVFWYEDMRYSLPASIPVNYQPVAVGATVTLPASMPVGKSYFLHFYNTDCPCSRFNARHIQTLIGQYSDSLSIIVVVDSKKSERNAKKEFGNTTTIMIDDGTVAKNCGVYSTPQAVIVDKKGALYYRGNYNSSRFCTTRATNFAELSLIALINNQPPPLFGIDATQSYGCELEQSSAANSIIF